MSKLKIYKLSIIATFGCTVFLTYGQKKLISVGVSNNGLLSKKIEQYYYPRAWRYGEYNSRGLDIMFDIRGDFLVSDKIYFNTKLGYGLLRYKSDNSPAMGINFARGLNKQTYKEIGIGVQYRIENKSLEFLVGLGIPFYLISGMNETSWYNDQSPILKYQTVYQGGFALGLNTNVGLRYFFEKNFFLMINIGAAGLYSKLGDSQKVVTLYSDPNLPVSKMTEDWIAVRGFEITRPDFSFGIGMKF